MWISLYHANTTDPGFLPRNIPEYDQAIRQVGRINVQITAYEKEYTLICIQQITSQKQVKKTK